MLLAPCQRSVAQLLQSVSSCQGGSEGLVAVDVILYYINGERTVCSLKINTRPTTPRPLIGICFCNSVKSCTGPNIWPTA